MPGAGGQQVLLNTLARIVEEPASLAIAHQEQFPVVTVSFNLAPGVALGAAVEEIRRIEGELGIPESIETAFEGTALAFQSALGNQLLLILAAVVVMYLVLGILYESFIHPITILSTLPSAAVGALLALEISGTELGVMAVIGIVLLIGIVKKNAIMMIDLPRSRPNASRAWRPGCDLPGLPAALPADLDDHARRPPRRPAPDDRQR